MQQVEGQLIGEGQALQRGEDVTKITQEHVEFFARDQYYKTFLLATDYGVNFDAWLYQLDKFAQLSICAKFVWYGSNLLNNNL